MKKHLVYPWCICTRKATLTRGCINLSSLRDSISYLLLSLSFCFWKSEKLNFRSMLAEPAFTYKYGYSFIILISSFLLSELSGKNEIIHFGPMIIIFDQEYVSGICAIFQFIYYHQYKWDQIEKNNGLENSGIEHWIKQKIINYFADISDKDPNSCKIIATMTNGTIKTLCDTKEQEWKWDFHVQIFLYYEDRGRLASRLPSQAISTPILIFN